MKDIHTHIFDEKCVPDKFIGSKFLQRVVNRYTLPLVLLMDLINPFSKTDVLSRYAGFIRNENKSQKNNLKELKKIYPEGTKFVILTVNMAGMGAGKVKKNIEEQLKEVIELKNTGEPILIFYHLEPTTESCLEILYKYQNYIDGLKVYTLMGHSPLHAKLLEGYKWAQDHNKPVIFHTSPDSPVYFKGSKRELNNRLRNLKPLINPKETDQHKLCANFINPRYYDVLCGLFPKMKLCFAHLGGEEEIKKAIRGEASMTTELLKICRYNENAYFDISSAFGNETIQKWLNIIIRDEVILAKCLYGSDYYMSKISFDINEYISNLKKNIGEKNFNIISEVNTEKFLA